MENPIGDINRGKNYLNPNLKLQVDEAIELKTSEELKNNLEKKLSTLISTELHDLVNLVNSKFKSNYLRTPLNPSSDILF